MKNNKGFTLVELLAVIVILAMLITIAVPSTIAISNKLKLNMYCKKIDSIEVSAKLYGEDRKESFTESYITADGTYTSRKITIKDLIDSGDLKKDNTSSPYVIDPRDDSSMDEVELTVYEKYNRIYVAFDDTIKTTCDK